MHQQKKGKGNIIQFAYCVVSFFQELITANTIAC